MSIKDLTQRWIGGLSLLLMTCLSCELAAQPIYNDRRNSYQVDDCDGTFCGLNKRAWWLIGGAAVGAVAGAGTATALTTKGKRGDPGVRGNAGKNGAIGPSGPSPFKHDPGSLTFTFLQNSPTPITTVRTQPPFVDPALIYPFVSTPDGQVFVGPESMEAANFNPSIVVPNPAFGTYHYGYLAKPGAVNGVTITPTATVTPAYHLTDVTITYSGPVVRDGTEDGNMRLAFNTLATIPVPLAPNNPTTGTGGDIQVTGAFTFGPNMTSPTYTPSMP